MTHNEKLIEMHTTEETRNAFNTLTPDDYDQWVMQAIEEFRSSEQTETDRFRYIGKIALVLDYWEKQE